MNWFVSGSRLLRLFVFASIVAGVATVALVRYRPPFAFEIKVDSSISGSAQLYYDVGGGIREEDSTIVHVRDGLQTCRFALRPGTYRALRFDPSDKPGNHIVLSGARLIDQAHRTITTFSPSEFSPVQQIDRFLVNGNNCDLQTSAEGSDSILYIRLDAPFTLVPDHAVVWRQAGLDFVKWLLVIFAAGLLLPIAGRKIQPMTIVWYQVARRWALARPRQAVCAVALFAALLSCYPVIFFGKSFVSPNILGSAMLYPAPPFLPGYHGTELEFPKGTDTGAMLWQNVPYSFIQSRALWQDHELPLWNRYNSAGAPLLAQGISMFGDPLHSIVLLAGGAAWAWDIKFVLAKALFCSALGLLVLRAANRLSIALLLSGSSAFIGFFSYRFDHPAFFSMCYAPWILLAWLELTRSGISRTFAFWGGVLVLASCAEINSGGVKEGYMLLCSMHGTGLLVFLLADKGGGWWKKLFYLVGLGLSFVLLSAPIWLAFIDTLKNSRTVYDVTPSFQIQPGLILGFFDEIFYRAVNSQADMFDPSANFLILLGCLAALAAARRLLRDCIVVALLVGALPCFALAFGIVPPAVIAEIPFLRNVGHIDNTFSCALIVHAIVLAGFGLSSLVGRLRKRDWFWDYAVMLAGFLVIVFLYLGFTQALQRPPDNFVPLGTAVQRNSLFYLYALSISAALLVLPLVGRAFFRGRLSRPVVVILFTVCCVLLHLRFGLHLKSNITAVDDIVMNPQVRADFKAKSSSIDWVRRDPNAGRAVGFGDVFFAGYDGIVGVETISGSDPLQNSYYLDLLLTGGVSLQWDWRWVVDKASWDRMLPFYNLLNVRYFLATANRPDLHLQNLAKAADFDLSVYQNNSAWPRAFFVEKAVVYDSTAQFVAMVKDNRSGPFAAISRSELQPQFPVLSADQTLDRLVAVPARDYKFTSNTTTFTIDASRPGIAVLTETFLPDDFILRVNGAPGHYFRVNHAFKGLLIPGPGTFTISFSYWPRRFTLSLLMAGGGALILTIWAFALFRRKPTGSPSLFFGTK